MIDEDDIPPDSLLTQVAALPFRMTSGHLEVLLITSRESGRWLIPKGWSMKNRTSAEAAAVEALEEAGVRGLMAEEPVGAYTYTKTLKDGVTALCRVQVYPLAVKSQAKKWKEKGQRRLEWMTPQEAAARVSEPELAQLLAEFHPARGLKP